MTPQGGEVIDDGNWGFRNFKVWSTRQELVIASRIFDLAKRASLQPRIRDWKAPVAVGHGEAYYRSQLGSFFP